MSRKTSAKASSLAPQGIEAVEIVEGLAAAAGTLLTGALAGSPLHLRRDHVRRSHHGRLADNFRVA